MTSNLMLTHTSFPNKNPRVTFSSSLNPRIKFRTNLVVAESPVGMQQRIIIPNKQGQKLVGVFHDTGSEKLAVLCHGFRSSKESNMMVNLAAALEKEGISAFRFDFSGNGESEGPFEYGNYAGETEDLRSVVEYFTGVERVPAVVLGHSKGGSVVLLYASKYHDIGAVVNVCGRYDLKSGLERRLGANFMETLKKDGYIDVKTKSGAVSYRVTEKSLLERVNTNMHEACLKIDKGCKVLTVHGSADETIPVNDALEFAKIIPNHELQIIEGADHKYSSHQDELTSVVLRFVKESLQ
ncbi:putative uncharacterized protein YDL057W isoform X1 [Salvia splendens]|uniref:putative uncharacterized protein YDL057W isoform X1 n=1 Tax=Salvia splendens TaxID=180675 RepID=UPI001C274DBA|nr:putative uncharacterized protein YDL057W isoform X1 [Salvia splendens]